MAEVKSEIERCMDIETRHTGVDRASYNRFYESKKTGVAMRKSSFNARNARFARREGKRQKYVENLSQELDDVADMLEQDEEAGDGVGEGG